MRANTPKNGASCSWFTCLNEDRSRVRGMHIGAIPYTNVLLGEGPVRFGLLNLWTIMNSLFFFGGKRIFKFSQCSVGTTWSLHIPCRGEVCLAILEADPLLQLTKCWLRHLLTPRPKGKETHGMSTMGCNVGNPITNLIINLPFKWMVESTHRNGDFDRFWGWFYCWAYNITHSYLWGRWFSPSHPCAIPFSKRHPRTRRTLWSKVQRTLNHSSTSDLQQVLTQLQVRKNRLQYNYENMFLAR